MAENPFKTPVDHAPLEADGRLKRSWRRFLSNIETLAGRQAAPVAQLDTGSTPTNDQLRDKINEILVALTNSDQMRSS